MIDNLKQFEISVIIPVHNGRATLNDCLAALAVSTFGNYEVLVVDDCSTDGTFESVDSHHARILSLSGHPHGPGFARNIGAGSALGNLLFFLDADVLVYPDTLAKIAQTFREKPEYDAVFGSYDEDPADGGFISQYKNLSHAFVHQQARSEAGTFWSGCGAIRKSTFLALGGFNETLYPKPSIEDIELGIRLKKSGGRILLNKDIQVKHLKHWSLWGLIRTDVVARGIPWTMLLLRDRSIPNDLNLNSSQRLSAFVAVVIALVTLANLGNPYVLFFAGAVALFPVFASLFQWESRPGLTPLFLLIFLFIGFLVAFSLWGMPVYFTLGILLLLTIILWLNRDYYRFMAYRRGLVFTLAVIPMQLLYYYYSLISFAIGIGKYFGLKFQHRKSNQGNSQINSDGEYRGTSIT